MTDPSMLPAVALTLFGKRLLSLHGQQLKGDEDTHLISAGCHKLSNIWAFLECRCRHGDRQRDQKGHMLGGDSHPSAGLPARRQQSLQVQSLSQPLHSIPIRRERREGHSSSYDGH